MDLSKFDKNKYKIKLNNKYDMYHLIYDVWETGFYPSKMDLLPVIMSIGKGEFYSTIVLEQIEFVLSNIDKFKETYKNESNK